jgi:rhomboid protease GluP
MSEISGKVSPPIANPQSSWLQGPVWDLPNLLTPKLEGVEYGYVCGGRAFASTREELIDLVQRDQPISFVWTPDSPEPVYPETVPFLLDALRAQQRRSARHSLYWGAGLIGASILIALSLQEWRVIYRNFFFALGGLLLTEGIWVYQRASNYTQAEAINDRSTTRFSQWLEKKKLSGYTVVLLACIVVVGMVQPLAEKAIDIAGLVKPAVRNGELWRLFTATLMHANFPHFWMNFLGLVFLSKVIEQTVQRACVPLVFLLTAPVGSIFSVVLYPNSTSIGASGGIMGLVGFITVAAYFDRARYPAKYFRRIVGLIIFTGLLGLFGFAFIDNAAHLGGLVGGLLFGWFIFRNQQWLKEKRRLFNYAGGAALLLLGFIAVFTIYRLLR